MDINDSIFKLNWFFIILICFKLLIKFAGQSAQQLGTNLNLKMEIWNSNFLPVTLLCMQLRGRILVNTNVSCVQNVDVGIDLWYWYWQLEYHPYLCHTDALKKKILVKCVTPITWFCPISHIILENMFTKIGLHLR